MSAKSYPSDSGFRRLLRPVGVGVIIGALITAAILALMSLLLASQNIPQSMLEPMAVFAMCAGAFASGFCCTRILRHNGLMCGFLCGMVFSVLMVVCSFAVPGNSLGLGALIKSAITIIAAMIGGVMGVNVNTKTRKK